MDKPLTRISQRLGSLDAGLFLFYLAFACYALGATLLYTSAIRSGFHYVQTLSTLLKLVAFLLLAFKAAAFQRYTVTQLGIVCALAVVGLLSYMVTDDMTFFAMILFIAAAKEVDVRVLAWIVIVVNVFVFGVAIVGSLDGDLQSVVMNRDGAVGVRSSIGFEHPNFFGLTLASACMALYVIRAEHIGIPEAVFSALCFLLIYTVSDSRTGMLGVLVGYLLFLAFSRMRGPFARRTLGLVLTALIVAAVAVSLFFMVAYDPSRALDKALNELMTGRLYFSNWYFENYPPGLFGQDVSQLPVFYSNGGHTTSQLVLDNAYARLYVRYGPIALALSLASLCWFLVRSNKLRAYGVVLVGLAFASIYGFGEHMFIRPEFNYFMVIGFSWLLYGFPEGENSEACREPAHRHRMGFGRRAEELSAAGLVGRRA